jgi:predicted O-methyltransferase YrrM
MSSAWTLQGAKQNTERATRRLPCLLADGGIITHSNVVHAEGENASPQDRHNRKNVRRVKDSMVQEQPQRIALSDS